MFQVERRRLKTEYSQLQSLWTAAIAGTLSCVAIPVVFAQYLPGAVKTIFLSGAVGGAGAATMLSFQMDGDKRRHHLAMERANQMAVEQAIAARATTIQMFQRVEQENEVMRLLQAMGKEPHLQQYWAKRLGVPLPQLQAMPHQTVTVAAQPVPARGQVGTSGAIATASPAVPVGYGQPMAWEQDLQQAGMQQAQDALPPYRDLAEELSQYPRHVALVCKTQSGKTTLLTKAILRDLENGRQVFVIDGKGSAELKRIPGINYILANHPDKVDKAIACVQWVLNEIVKRYDEEYKEPGITLYIDENNNILRFLKFAGIEGTDGTKRDDKWWGIQTELIVTQGASANVRFRATAHTSRCENWNWNTGIMDNISFIALARQGEYESIDDLIEYQVPKRNKAEWAGQLEQFRPLQLQEPIAASLLPPHGFYRVPFYQVPQFQGKTEQWQPEGQIDPSKLVDAPTAYAALRKMNLDMNQRHGRDLLDEELRQAWAILTGVEIPKDDHETINVIWVMVNEDNA